MDIIDEKNSIMIQFIREMIKDKCGGNENNCMQCVSTCDLYALGNALYDYEVVKSIHGGENG
jgi:hypothetical protein